MFRSRALSLIALGFTLWWGVGTPSAQAPAGESPAAQPATRMPRPSLAEMEAAGVRMAFDVASVKPDRSGAPAYSRFPLGPGDGYTPGGFFTASNQPLIVYLRFAYKLGQSDLVGLPAWVYADRFDIEARAQGIPTKDQMRLMMQSLLVDRFKLVTHTERQTKPVLNLVLARAGKTGPQLRAHPAKESCAVASTSTPPGAARPGAPSEMSSIFGVPLTEIACGSAGPMPASVAGRARLVGRNVSIGRIAALLMNPFAGLDRPVLDRTGLMGTFDFGLEWSLPSESAQTPASHPQDDDGPTFLEALREQLGLTLKSSTGPVDVLVIDHVEHPTEN